MACYIYSTTPPPPINPVTLTTTFTSTLFQPHPGECYGNRTYVTQTGMRSPSSARPSGKVPPVKPCVSFYVFTSTTGNLQPCRVFIRTPFHAMHSYPTSRRSNIWRFSLVHGMSPAVPVHIVQIGSRFRSLATCMSPQYFQPQGLSEKTITHGRNPHNRSK